jgi:hypothetical protein
VGHLAAKGPFDDRLLEPADYRVELLWRQRPLPDELIENL